MTIVAEWFAPQAYESDVIPIMQNLKTGETEKALSTAEAWSNRASQQDTTERVTALMMLAEATVAAGLEDKALTPAKEAVSLAERSGDTKLIAASLSILANVSISCDIVDECADKAKKASHIYKDLKDDFGMGFTALLEAKAAEADGSDPTSALRLAEKAERLLHIAGADGLEVEAMLIMVSCQMQVCKEQKSTLPLCVQSLAKTTLTYALTRRPDDEALEGKARMNLAKAFLSLNVYSMAASEASESSRLFRHVGDDKLRGAALTVNAEAEAKRGGWKKALKTTEKAIAICEDADNAEGKAEALALLDIIDDVRRKEQGLPSRAQEAASMQKALEDKKAKEAEAMQSQYAAMMQMQMMMAGRMGGAPPGGFKNPAVVLPQASAGGGAAPAAEAGPVAIQREGSVLQVSKGMDPEVIVKKIQSIARSITGEEEDIEQDTPLMQAGLTSNTAVILRDELAKDIPGVSLPPTLLFDYPSIGAIAEFVVEKAG